MAKVSAFLYCDSIENLMTPMGPKLTISNPLQVFTPAYIPGNFSFGILLGIIGFDTKAKHNLRILFKYRETEKVIFDTNIIEFPIQAESKFPTDLDGTMINMDLRNVVIEKPGEYFTEVIFDGEKIGEYPIWAITV